LQYMLEACVTDDVGPELTVDFMCEIRKVCCGSDRITKGHFRDKNQMKGKW